MTTRGNPALEVLQRAFQDRKDGKELAARALAALYGHGLLHLVQTPLWERTVEDGRDVLKLEGRVNNVILTSNGSAQAGWGFENAQWEQYRQEEIRQRYLRLMSRALGLEKLVAPPPHYLTRGL